MRMSLVALAGLVAVGCTNDFDGFAFDQDGGAGAATGGGAGSSGSSAAGGAGGTGGTVAGTGGTAAGTGGAGSSCADLYSGETGVNGVCAGEPGSCELRYDATKASCTEICSSAGATCQGAFNNAGQCGHGQKVDCGATTLKSAICVCSH